MTRHPTSTCTIGVDTTSLRRRADIVVAGELDADAAPALDDAVARIAAVAPQRVVVDLAGVTFAGSTLPNFLVRLVDALPNEMTVTVCRPRQMPRWVLDTTGMDRILTITADRPGA